MDSAARAQAKYGMKKLIMVGFLWASTACASLPGERHEGGCLPFALAYAAKNPDAKIVIVTYPTSPGKLAAHAFIHLGGWLCDNMHPDLRAARGDSAVGWAYDLGYRTFGLSLFRTIDLNNLLPGDLEVIEYLKRTVPK